MLTVSDIKPNYQSENLLLASKTKREEGLEKKKKKKKDGVKL